MCGIAGCIVDRRFNSNEITETLELMKNRGPDFQGFEEINIGNKFVYLFHSRLNIIDLNPRSNQPFVSGNLILVFNGEIYNYIELREILIQKGYHFKTTSDTEVLMNAFIEFGKEIEKYLEGMWSFVFFNKKSNEFFISRDRFGEKPLYYLENNNNFYFASEIKFIKRMFNKTLSINYEVIKRYLVYGYKYVYKKNPSYYNEIKQLKHSTNLSFIVGSNIKFRNYWQPTTSEKKMSLSDSISGAKYYLEKSLQKRLRSDVPIAFHLSGGVDSSSLVSIAKKKFDTKIHSYSIIDHDPRYNEEENINKSVDSLCDSHKYIDLKDNFSLSFMSNLIKYHDQPLCTINFVAQALLQEQISKDGYRVSISGTAADEIFTGYYDHHLYYLHSIKKKSNYESSLQNWKKYIKKNIQNPFLSDALLFDKKGESFRDYISLDSELFKSMLIDYNYNEIFNDEIYDNESIVKNRMLNELLIETIPIFLQNDDLNAMKFSIENRSPYLDTDLINFMFSVPTEHYIQNGYSKYILRESTKNILNDQVRLDRNKKGYNASIDSFLNLKDKTTIEYLMENSPIFEIVNRKNFEDYLLGTNFYNNHNKKYLFSFLNCKMFLELNE